MKTDCPAKLNLYLAVTCKRNDGWHELVSLVAKLELCDSLACTVSESGRDTLVCDDPDLSAGSDNLVLKAAAAFRKRVPDSPFMDWTLDKRIPYGAGMGGGSSDAAAALRLLNAACGQALNAGALLEIAAGVGSDCPLFLHEGPCVMRGRGERISPLPEAAVDALAGRDVVVVKPHFSIPTAWAYSTLDRAAAFTGETVAEGELGGWIAEPASSLPVRNSFERPVFQKYLCYEAMNRKLVETGLPRFILTGSGSACYAFAEGPDAEAMLSAARTFLGEECFAMRTRISGA